VQDIVNVPQLHKLINHASMHVEAREYEEIIQLCATAGSDEANQARINSYNEWLGLRVLHWILHITWFDPNAATYISNAGISPPAVQSVVIAAIQTIEQFGTLDVTLIDNRMWDTGE
jgi:hypothetical protein